MKYNHNNMIHNCVYIIIYHQYNYNNNNNYNNYNINKHVNSFKYNFHPLTIINLINKICNFNK